MDQSFLHLDQYFSDLDLDFLNFTLQRPITQGVITRIKSRYGPNINHRTLSFFGDTVLEMITAKRLIDFSGLSFEVVDYHKIKQNFVNNQNLTTIAIEIGLCSLFPDAVLNQGKDWHNPCSDTLEALLGMLFLEYEDTEKISNWFFSLTGDNFQEKIYEQRPEFRPIVEEKKEEEKEEEKEEVEKLPRLEVIPRKRSNENKKRTKVIRRLNKINFIPVLTSDVPAIYNMTFGNLSMSRSIAVYDPFLFYWFIDYFRIINNDQKLLQAFQNENYPEITRILKDFKIEYGLVGVYSRFYQSPSGNWYGHYINRNGFQFPIFRLYSENVLANPEYNQYYFTNLFFYIFPGTQAERDIENEQFILSPATLNTDFGYNEISFQFGFGLTEFNIKGKTYYRTNEADDVANKVMNLDQKFPYIFEKLKKSTPRRLHMSSDFVGLFDEIENSKEPNRLFYGKPRLTKSENVAWIVQYFEEGIIGEIILNNFVILHQEEYQRSVSAFHLETEPRIPLVLKVIAFISTFIVIDPIIPKYIRDYDFYS